MVCVRVVERRRSSASSWYNSRRKGPSYKGAELRRRLPWRKGYGAQFCWQRTVVTHCNPEITALKSLVSSSLMFSPTRIQCTPRPMQPDILPTILGMLVISTAICQTDRATRFRYNSEMIGPARTLDVVQIKPLGGGPIDFYSGRLVEHGPAMASLTEPRGPFDAYRDCCGSRHNLGVRFDSK